MNTTKITKKTQKVCGIITEMNQVILFLLTLNLLNAKQVLLEKHPNIDVLENVRAVLPLKKLSNLNVPLINCEIESILAWYKNCTSADMTVRAAGNNNDPPAIFAQTGLEFQIIHTNLYAPIVTLSTENDKKLLEQLKSRFKRTIKWNEYRSQITIQSNNNNLNYLIDPTFTKVKRLFVLSFARIARENDITKDYRDSFSSCYVPYVETKDSNVLIDGKCVFDLPVKNKEEA